VVLQILRSFSLPCLRLQIITGSYAEWFVSYTLFNCHFLNDFWRRVIPYTLFRLKVHGGYNRSAEDAYSSVAPDPTFAFVGGPCCPTKRFSNCLLDYDCDLHIVNVAILYSNSRDRRKLITPVCLTTFAVIYIVGWFPFPTILFAHYKLLCANGVVLTGTSLLYKWQRMLSNRQSYQLSSIATIWDVPLQTGRNMF
jgi:hypothetical protein